MLAAQRRGGFRGNDIQPAKRLGGQPTRRRDGWQRRGCVDVPGSVNPHRQIVLTEGDDASAEPPHLPLAHHRRLEVETDPDPKPEHQRSNPLPRRFVGRDGRQLVDRDHQRVNLSFGAGRLDYLRRPRGQLVDPPGRLVALGLHLVEGLGEGFIPGIVLFAGHTMPGRGEVLIKFLELPPKTGQRGILLALSLTGRLSSGLRQESLTDGFAAACLRDAFDQRIKYQF